jgi:mannitol-1-phosphate/altronate dehydrogenase
VTLAALALAAWCQYLLGKDDDGQPMTLSADPRMELAQRHAQASVTDPVAFLGFVEVFGERLPRAEPFVSAFTSALSSLREVGTHRTLERWLTKET